MSRKEKNSIFWTVFIITIMIVVIVGSIIHYFKVELKRQDSLQKQIQNGQFGNTFTFYMMSNPNLNNRQYYGINNASITLIGYLDPTSESGRFFINNNFPQLKNEFIDTGSVKFYPKYYVTEEDITNKNDNFIYATYISCMEKADEKKYFDFYLDTFQLQDKSQLSGLIVKYNLSVSEFNDCLSNTSMNEIYEDASEIRRFGMLGISPRFYVGIEGRDNRAIDGVPNYNSFKRVIKLYQFMLGE